MIKQKVRHAPWVLITNILLITGIVIAFVIYNIDYQGKLKQQNINDIVNINQSTATISSAFLNAQSDRLLDICKYAAHQQMTRPELLAYIENSVFMDYSSFQLVQQNNTGFLADKSGNDYLTVNYSSHDYAELHQIFSAANNQPPIPKVLFSSEFTDNYTGYKSFALYCYVPVLNEDGNTEYNTLMAVSSTANFMDYTNIDGGFDHHASVLINPEGDYILGNSAFKSTNFFQYLYVFNNLTLDEQKEIARQVNTLQKGELYYKNSLGQDCVFVYAYMPETQWYCVSSVPISSFHGQANDFRLIALIIILLIILTLVDVTWLMRLNTQLKASALEAEKANVAKTDFLSRMSHDIRTPLNVITGMAYMALQENPKPVITEYLENIQSSGKFLTGLVNDILDLNKVESGKMELHPAPYSLKEFIRYIDAIIVPQCQDKNLSFKLQKNIAEDASILVDSLRFNQIFFNLLSNAVKYTPNGGHILFSIEMKKQESEQIQLDFLVQDDGIGMSKEFQAHLFEAFSQENVQKTTEQSGTGLGLAIVKSILDLMQGTITVKSAPNKGTSFHVQLHTYIVPSSPEVYVDDIENKDITLSGKRVLLCEDHPMNTMIVKNLLEKQNMLVDAEANGQLGLERFKQSPQEFYDVILMDIQMPVMDGMTATREIRKLQRPDAQTIPIIAMTANAYDIDIQNSLDAGMNAHIAKPIDPDAVHQTIAHYISH